MDFDHSNFHESVESSEEYDNGKVYQIGDQVIFRDATYKMVKIAGSPGYAPERAGDKLWIKIKDEPLLSTGAKASLSPTPDTTVPVPISDPIYPAPATGSPTNDAYTALDPVHPSFVVFRSPSFKNPSPPSIETPVPPVFRSPVPPICGSPTPPLIASSSETKSTGSSYILHIIITIIIISLVTYAFSK
jgi:hypothetical protein